MANLLNLKYMKAQYDFLTVPSTKKGSRAVIYPKLVSGGTVSFMELAEQIDRASGFQKGTVIGVVEEIERWAQHYLQHGRRVRIGNLGTLSVGLKALRPVEDEAAIHAQSVRFGKVRFTVSRKFRCHGTLERAGASRKFRESSRRLTEEARYGLLMDYLTSHAFITRTRYTELTGLLRTLALKELNRWLEEGKIGSEGRGSHKVYVRKPETGDREV